MPQVIGKIDKLPLTQKQAVIDAILRGESLRKVAALAGCSAMVVSRFRDNVVLPSLGTHRPGHDPLQPRQPSTSDTPAPKQCPDSPLAVSKDETKLIARASPVRQRLQHLWEKTDKFIGQVDGKDRTAPGLLAQAHKNIELLAKVTGEIDSRAGSGPSIAVQIVMPATSAEPAITVEGNQTVIDVPGVRIGLKSSS